jgi:thiol-disulfide isomerase/thioredoxin
MNGGEGNNERGELPAMRWPFCFAGVTAVVGASALLLLPLMASADDGGTRQTERSIQDAHRPLATGESAAAINDDYNRELLQLERRRLARLERLAASQNAKDAAATYEQLFRLAIGGDLFREAEPAARAVLQSGSPSAVAIALAHLVKIIAEADRGAFEQSVESLRSAVAEREKAEQRGIPRAELPTSEIVAICDAYYQRLIHAGQFDQANKALQIVLGHTRRPVLREFLTSRLKRLELVSKPAPPIDGTDLEGKPFSLAAAKGKVVLVIFWASWCVPCAAEIESLRQVASTYGPRGLQVVGINLDVTPDGTEKLETVLPNIRHFLLDHNVGWPTLINGQADKDYAQTYGITEIPANVLIGRAGTVDQIDMVSRNLQTAISRAVRE